MKKLFAFLSILSLFAVSGLASSPAQAQTKEGVKSFKKQLDAFTPGAFARVGVGHELFYNTVKKLTAVYDFATLGGAVGTVVLRDYKDTSQQAQLPDGAIVRDCLIDVVTAPTSGGSATIALGTGQSTTDLKAATAIASYTGLVACVPVGSAATAIKLTADRKPSATIATAALTAGVVNVHISYELSE
jgi:hypothetical protein